MIPRFGLATLSEAQRDTLNRVWHRLLPWPDTIGGMQRLRARRPLAALSNGNVSLLVNMARHAGLTWDCVLSAELARAYKPDPQVYLLAAQWLGVAPHELMLVAAHPSDLCAAAACGLRTAYVHRPLEFGADVPREHPGAGSFDLHAQDFIDLARQLDA